jgi:hypothetical protein
MSNVLSVYDPLFYAQEALIQLEKALGMAGRVHRGYDKSPQQKGSIIEIRRPSTFTAQDAPSAAQGIAAGAVAITLDQWKEVKIALTDKELSATGNVIIEEHIKPAAYAIADNIDQALTSLYKDIGWYVVNGSPVAVSDFTAARLQLFTNQAPMGDDNLHLMLSGTQESESLNLTAFSQWQGAGQAAVDTQMRGSLGRKFGMEIFANQNVKTHTSGVSADATGALTANAAAGATTIAFDSITTAGTVVAGDSFTLTGDSQRYVFTAPYTASSGAIPAASIFPALKVAHVIGDVITITLQSGEQGLAFHRNAFALAMAPLSDLGNQLGAKIATVTDPVTGLSLRSRLFYIGDSSQVVVAIDALYGIKTLDPNLACRFVN